MTPSNVSVIVRRDPTKDIENLSARMGVYAIKTRPMPKAICNPPSGVQVPEYKVSSSPEKEFVAIHSS